METVKTYIMGMLDFSHIGGEGTVFYIAAIVIIAALLMYVLESLVKMAVGVGLFVLLYNYIQSPDAASWAVTIKEWIMGLIAIG